MIGRDNIGKTKIGDKFNNFNILYVDCDAFVQNVVIECHELKTGLL